MKETHRHFFSTKVGSLWKKKQSSKQHPTKWFLFSLLDPLLHDSMGVGGTATGGRRSREWLDTNQKKKGKQIAKTDILEVV